MNFLFDVTAKASVVLLVALIATVFCRRKSAAVRHRILSVAVVVATLTPAIAIVGPAWHTTQADIAPASINLPVESSAPSRLIDVPAESAVSYEFEDLRFVWLGGLVVGLFSLLVGTSRLLLVTAASRPLLSDTWSALSASIAAEYELSRDVRLLQGRSPSMLATWGILSPKVILPAGASEWTRERAEVVLSHELAHVRRHDWFVQVISELLRAVLWFNPLVWIVCARLRIESEYACDDAALVRGIASADYASQLLDLARILNVPNRAWSAALGMARPSTLERRFQAMLNSSLNRRPVTNATLIAIVVAMLGFALPIATYSSTPRQVVTSGLSGRVSDSSGAVVRSATVVVSTPDGKTEVTGTTNANGRFAFTNLPAGMHVVQVFATGFGPSRITNVELKGGLQTVQDVTMDIGFVAVEEAKPAAARPRTVASPAPRPAQANVPEGQGSLSGTVTDPSGAVVPGVLAALEYASGVRRTVLTKEDGVFTFEAVTNGSYRLVISLPGFKTLNIDNVIVSGPTVYPNTIRLAIATMAEDVTVRSTTSTSSDQNLSDPAVCAALPPAPPPSVSTPTVVEYGSLRRIRQGGNVQQAMLLGQVRPLYPAEAKAAGAEGAVIMETIVGRDGRILEVKVISGHPLLIQAAVDAVRRWCYKPTLLNGQPVEVVSTVSVNFVMQ
jgi:TonB family protein